MQTHRLAALGAATLTLGLGLAPAQAADPATPVGVAPAATALSAGPCARTQAMAPLQRRLVAKASQGPDALRDFIWNTRGVYQLDMESTGVWLAAERSGQLACEAGRAAPVVAQR